MAAFSLLRGLRGLRSLRGLRGLRGSFFLRAAEVHVRILSNFAASNVRCPDGVEGGRQNPKPKGGGIKDVIKMNSL